MQILFLLAIMLAPLATICSAQTVSTKTFGTGANQFTIDFVTIGNPNNLADPNASPRPAGAVSYIYRMGKYEVSRDMITKANAEGSLGISMLSMSSFGGNGSNRPATRLTWYGAMVFVNWLNTSTGGTPAYKTDVKGLFQVWTPSDAGYQASNPYRNSLAKYWLPSIDEWHKAAYSSLSGTWYRLATGTDGFYPENPTSVLSGTAANTIVCGWGSFVGPADITNAGGLSPYGTMAQNGNVEELVETAYDGANDTTGEYRSFRGGSWETSYITTVASSSMGWLPSESSPTIGFRVAMVAETSSNPLPNENIALGKTVTASSVYQNDGTYSADKIVNGSTSETPLSFWMPKGANDSQSSPLPAWLVIDLGSVYQVSSISFLNALNSPYNDRGAKDFTVEKSLDGVSYSSSGLAGTLVWQNTSFQDYALSTATSVRYLKISFSSAYGSYGCAALNEVRVYADQTPLSYSLTASCDQTKGSIIVSPNQTNYPTGNLVTVSASTLSGYLFINWSGDISGTTPSVSLIMDANKSITANFGQDTRDNDADGLSNYLEIVTHGTNPDQKDTNSDGIEDGQAVTLGYSPTFNFSALITHLQSHPPTGLYTASQMQSMAIGDLVLTKNANGSFTLNYDIEQSSDLQSWLPYQSFNLPLTNLPPDKAFIRFRAKQ